MSITPLAPRPLRLHDRSEGSSRAVAARSAALLDGFASGPLAHPAAWRRRAELAVAAETTALLALDVVSTAQVSVEGDPSSLVLRISCTTTGAVLPVDVVRDLNDDLPTRLERAVGLPLTERHLVLAVTPRSRTAAA